MWTDAPMCRHFLCDLVPSRACSNELTLNRTRRHAPIPSAFRRRRLRCTSEPARPRRTFASGSRVRSFRAESRILSPAAERFL